MGPHAWQNFQRLIGRAPECSTVVHLTRLPDKFLDKELCLLCIHDARQEGRHNSESYLSWHCHRHQEQYSTAMASGARRCWLWKMRGRRSKTIDLTAANVTVENNYATFDGTDTTRCSRMTAWQTGVGAFRNSHVEIPFWGHV